MKNKIAGRKKILAILVAAVFIILSLSYFLLYTKPVLKTELEFNAGWEGPWGKVAVATCTFDKELLTGQDAMFQIDLTALSDLGNSNLSLYPSEGLGILGQNTNWTGNLSNGASIILSYNFSVAEPGYYNVEIILMSSLKLFINRQIIYFEVTPSHMIMDSEPENNWYEPNQLRALSFSENNENFTVNISLSSMLELNKEVTIVYEFKSSIDILDGQRNQMTISFPPNGFRILGYDMPVNSKEYISPGQYSWKGEIKKNETYQMSVRFKIVEEGNGTIGLMFNAQKQDGIEDMINDSNLVQLYVDKYKANYEIIYSFNLTSPASLQ